MELIIGIIEAAVAFIVLIVKATIGFFIAIIGAIASLFVTGAEALSLWELIAVLFVSLIEALFWFIFWSAEIIASIFKRRRPKKVKKPILWRPKKILKKKASENKA